MTPDPSKANDYNIGCCHFLLGIKTKELDIPDIGKNLSLLILVVMRFFNNTEEPCPKPSNSKKQNILVFIN